MTDHPRLPQPLQARRSSRLLRHTPWLGGVAALIYAVAASAGPVDPDRDLRRAIREASQKELSEAQERPDVRPLRREARSDQLRIKQDALEELSRMAGPASYANDRLNLGKTLFDTEQPVEFLTLERAVRSTVRNNLNVQFARLAPAVSQNQLTQAEAAFDWVLFSNAQWSETDQPRTATSQFGVRFDERNTGDLSVGVRKPLISGGVFTVQHQFTYTDNDTPGLAQVPNPSRDANVVIQLDQPLLRNFGSDVALAQVRLARNGERDEIQSLKASMLQTITNTEIAYWSLVRATHDLLILQRLYGRGQDVLGVLSSRKDARPSNISNASSAVESRLGDIISAQRVVRDASDQIKVLMNDPDLPVGAEVLLLPADVALDQPISFSLVDSINTALGNRPEVQRAIISMDNTAIRERVADSARLPQLNFRALTRISGQGGSTYAAYNQVSESKFVDYQLLLQFEMPIGNRAAEAAYRGRRLERMQANLAYQNTIQNVVFEVKSALREISSNYVLIEQRRNARIAASEDLRQLLIDEQTNISLTPEFLDRKLRFQQALAGAEQQEMQALTDYNIGLARLHLATGTALERNRIIFDVPHVRPETRTSDLFPDYPGEPNRR